jgi:hypothetical protein
MPRLVGTGDGKRSIKEPKYENDMKTKTLGLYSESIFTAGNLPFS